MTVFLHDGTVPGFLCATAELLNARLGEAFGSFAVRSAAAGTELFEEAVPVPRDDERARRLWTRLSGRVGAVAAGTLIEAFLSDVPGADGAAAAMAVRLWTEGARALDDLSEPNAADVERASKRTTGEAHRFIGFVRFAELSDGSWYARIAPDCDVLPLIADHFAERFPAMRWAIHDERRGTAVLHEEGPRWIAVEDFTLAQAPGGGTPFSENELGLRAAWKRYFESTAIGSRLNPRLQTSFLPKKHRRNLPEMESPSIKS